MLKTFIKSNYIWIILMGIIIGVQELIMLLLGIQPIEILYILFLDIFLCLLFGLGMFYRYVKKIQDLRQNFMAVISDTINFPEAENDIEACYQDWIENINIARQLELASEARMQREMREYYDMWVHQIKTPIAAMHLLLQEFRDTEVERGEAFVDEPGDATSEATDDSIGDCPTIDAASEFFRDSEEELFEIEQYVSMALQYQRMNATTNDFVLQTTNIDKVIRETIRKYARILIKRHIKIDYEGTDICVISDEKWLMFVLEQLLSNCLKYSQKGTISFEVDRIADGCQISVSDEGIGIAADDIPRVCEKGYTGYNGHSDKRSTGIGLYLCKKMLDKLGHSISIQSQVGVGTTVTIEIKKTDIVIE